MAKRIFALILIIFLPPLSLFAAFVRPPNNLNVQISQVGDVPEVSIPCNAGSNFTLLLTHRDLDTVVNSLGPVERKYCGDDNQITFSAFNIWNPYNIPGSNILWQFVHTPLEYIIKDTTNFGGCYSTDNCQRLNLSWAGNGYNNSVYLASSTEYTTVGAGPVFDSSPDHLDWFNAANGDGSLNISTTTNEVATGTSVVFFPGIMGSKLYEDGNERWVSALDSDHNRLTMDVNGKSINSVYTKDDTQSISDEGETGITDEIFGQNIYNSFINDLQNWKTEETIKDYAFIPYDWRLSLEDIITKGATTTEGKLSYDNEQDFSESYILKKLRELGSKSANITLIGHSNGGLVIKALVQKLEETNDPLYYKIDKIIFVAVPQVGTPEAVLDLLHGTSLGFGLVMTNERARYLSTNMPMTYNLLPSSAYFGSVSNKVVTFQNSPAYQSSLSQYGNTVDNSLELRNYILGTDGRSVPGYEDTDSPSIGNGNLYPYAEAMHSILDNWQPASTTKVIQIAGWGEETLAGVDYEVCKGYLSGDHKCFSPRVVVDGDGTVVTPSALWISTSTPNVESWWVDLKKANTIVTKKRIHRDILEVDQLRDFINSALVIDDLNQNDVVVNNTSNLLSGDSKLHYVLHSPLTLGVSDSQGRYTGLDPVTKQIREEIPGVTYRIIGDTQFISVPTILQGQVKLYGYDVGTFSLDVEKQIGNSVVESTSFQGLPTSTTTLVFLDINPTISSTSLKIDIDGNGNVDKILNPSEEESIIYDDVPPEISITYSTTTRRIIFGGVDINNVVTSVGTSTVSTIDSQNNKTTLFLSKFKQEKSESEVVFNRISRNGKITKFQNIEVKFELSIDKRGKVDEFESSVKIAGVSQLSLKYNSEKNTTTIKERKNGVYVTTKRNGLIIETLTTNGSGVVFGY